MTNHLSVAGITIQITIPQIYYRILIIELSPFLASSPGSFDAFFSVEVLPASNHSACTTPILPEFHSTGPLTFSYFDHRFSTSFSFADKTALVSLHHDSADAPVIIFNSLKWFISYLVIHTGGLPIHSSLMSIDNRGFLFCGSSGKGKSTISRLLQEHNPHYLRGSDELNFIYKKNDRAYCYPSPVHSSAGKSEFTTPLYLHHIYFLEHSLENNAVPSTRMQALKKILQNIFKRKGTAYMENIVLNTLTLLSVLPIFSVLRFKNDGSISTFIAKAANAHEIRS